MHRYIHPYTHVRLSRRSAMRKSNKKKMPCSARPLPSFSTIPVLLPLFLLEESWRVAESACRFQVFFLSLWRASWWRRFLGGVDDAHELHSQKWGQMSSSHDHHMTPTNSTMILGWFSSSGKKPGQKRRAKFMARKNPEPPPFLEGINCKGLWGLWWCFFGGELYILSLWNTLPETNSSHLKIDGWKTTTCLLRWDGVYFRRLLLVSFRECKKFLSWSYGMTGTWKVSWFGTKKCFFERRLQLQGCCFCPNFTSFLLGRNSTTRFWLQWLLNLPKTFTK